MLSTSGDFTAGLLTSYEEHHTDNSMLLRKDFTWTQTSAGSPYAGTLISTLNPGQAYAAATKTVQTLDICGNVTQQQAYDYPRGTTPGRTYAFTYQHSQIGRSYLSRYLLNRVTSATVTPPAGPAVTLFTKAYESGSCSLAMPNTNAINNHDPLTTLPSGYAETSLGPPGNPQIFRGKAETDPNLTQRIRPVYRLYIKA
jgi:hypothetical protein